jgi:hypothetical protein
MIYNTIKFALPFLGRKKLYILTAKQLDETIISE